MTDFELSELVLKSAYKVHTKLGSGLLEKVYQVCLSHELKKAGLKCEVEKPVAITYDELVIEKAFKIDILVEGRLVLELKVVDEINDNYVAQVLSYLKFSKVKYGLILNFKERSLSKGIRRVAR